MELVHTTGTLTFDPNKGLSMSAIADSLFKITPRDPSLHVIGVDFTLIGLQCKTFGIIDPIKELQEAAARLYNYAMQAFIQPIWNGLYSLYQALKKFGLGLIDLKLPVLDLRISDLFNPDLYGVIERAITKLYNSAKDKIVAILNALGIPWPLFKNLVSPEEEIRYIIKHILASLWAELNKKINLIKDLIQTGLRIYDLIVYKKLLWSELWKAAVDQFLKTIIRYLTSPPSIEDIKRAIIAFAKKVLNKVEVTIAEILSVIQNFTLPIIGNPFDWLFPLNIHVNFPDVDFNKILGDIKLWINNFIMNLIIKFIKLVKRILSIFGIVIELPKISVPISICAYRINPV